MPYQSVVTCSPGLKTTVSRPAPRAGLGERRYGVHVRGSGVIVFSHSLVEEDAVHVDVCVRVRRPASTGGNVCLDIGDGAVRPASVHVADVLHVGEAVQVRDGRAVSLVGVLAAAGSSVDVDDDLEVDIRVGGDAGDQGIPGAGLGIDV